MSITRYATNVDDGTVYVGTDDGHLTVGSLETILDLLGGPAWEITYSAWDRKRYPDRDMSDEGIVIDVVDAINAMTIEEEFVETLAAQPGGAADPSAVSPRLGLFLGRLLENLENGVE